MIGLFNLAMIVDREIAMKVANIAELKNNLSQILSFVEKGEKVQVCKRNIPIAYIVPLDEKKKENMTQLNCGKGSVVIKSDLTEPMIPETNWEMFKNEVAP